MTGRSNASSGSAWTWTAPGRRLDGDPQRARVLIAEALEQSREALAELRALSRGIAPPILADRGLEAALAAAIENAAYFVAARP